MHTNCRSELLPIDVDGEVGFKRRVYNGTAARAVETFRIVGVWNDEEDRYHLYITNLPAEDYRAPDIAKLYQTRWEVELLFRELKTTYGLDEIGPGKPEVVITEGTVGYGAAFGQLRIRHGV